MAGLTIAIGKAKTSKEGGAGRDYAKEAYSALKDDDEEGFITAFLGAVRACSKKDHAEDEE